MESKLTQKAGRPSLDSLASNLIIRAPSADEEYERLVWTIRRLPWYRENGYSSSLLFPTHPVFEQMTMEGSDLSALGTSENKNLFVNEIFNQDSYTGDVQLIESFKPQIMLALDRLGDLHKHWGFILFPRYLFLISHYGTLSSYEETSGQVTLRPKDTKAPIRPILSSLIFLGIETVIVNRYSLGQKEKVRIVDTICNTLFGDMIPEIKFGFPGEAAELDAYLDGQAMDFLPAAIEKYVNDYPRAATKG